MKGYTKNGSHWVSKDGNVYDNPFEANAADTRYNQQQKIIEELQKQNSINNVNNNYHYSYTGDDNESWFSIILKIIIIFGVPIAFLFFVFNILGTL